jgi:hypothetical protein
MYQPGATTILMAMRTDGPYPLYRLSYLRRMALAAAIRLVLLQVGLAMSYDGESVSR